MQCKKTAHIVLSRQLRATAGFRVQTSIVRHYRTYKDYNVKLEGPDMSYEAELLMAIPLNPLYSQPVVCSM